MAKILSGVIMAVVSLAVVSSLKCNKCSYGLLGFCFSNSELQCSTNSSVCFTGKASFPSLPSVGFNTQGCTEPAGCNATINGSLLGVSYQTRVDCCSTDKCNPVTVSGAAASKATVAAIATAAILAALWGSAM